MPWWMIWYGSLYLVWFIFASEFKFESVMPGTGTIEREERQVHMPFFTDIGVGNLQDVGKWPIFQWCSILNRRFLLLRYVVVVKTHRNDNTIRLEWNCDIQSVNRKIYLNMMSICFPDIPPTACLHWFPPLGTSIIWLAIIDLHWCSPRELDLNQHSIVQQLDGKNHEENLFSKVCYSLMTGILSLKQQQQCERLGKKAAKASSRP